MTAVRETDPGTSPTHVVQPHRGLEWPAWNEVWSHRELLFFLGWRDVKVRYKQTAFGVAWAILQPLLLMVVFSVFLGYLAKIPSPGAPYPVFVYSALIVWTFFANTLSTAAHSVIGAGDLVSKVYFPRLILPLSSLGPHLVDLCVAFALLLGLMLVFGLAPTASVLLFPLFVLLAAVTAVGVGTLLAAINVRYRDVKYAMSFLVQLWFFSSPIVYPSSLVPEGWRSLYSANPMTVVAEGSRWTLLGTSPPSVAEVAIAGLVALALLSIGVTYFHNTEPSFPDLL